MNIINAILDETLTYDTNSNIVSMGTRKGKYYVDRTNYFFMLDTLGCMDTCPLGLAEKTEPCSMFRVDIDYKETSTELHPLYTETILLNHIYTIQSFLNSYTDNTDCLILTKQPYKKNENTISHGIHLQFINLFIDNDTFRFFEDKLSSIVNFKYDKIVNTPWLLYPCSKGDGLEPYKPQYVINNKKEKIDLQTYFTNYKVYNEREQLINIDTNKIQSYMSHILSIRPNNREYTDIVIPQVIETKIIKENKTKIQLENINYNNVFKMLDNLNNTRWEDYHTWFKLTNLLVSLNIPDEKIHEYSERGGDKYNYIETQKLIDTFNPDKCSITLGTLGFYYKEDTGNKPLNTTLTNQNEIVPETDEEIGIYIANQFIIDKNIYYSPKKNSVFIYDEKLCIFQENFEVETLIRYISPLIIPLIDKKLSTIEDSENNSKIIKQLLKQRKEIQSTSKQRAVFKQIKYRLPNSDEFIKKTFNNIPYLFPIANNQVINFKTLEVIPRTREHYFTYTTENIFKKERPNRFNIDNYIRDILKTTNPDFVASYLTWQGYNLTGENCVKTIAFFTGDGDNGKSVATNLQKSVAGQSWVVANDKVFLQSKANAVHFDEILPLIGKRSTSIQEIDKDSVFNEKILKTISGNDGDLSVRGCGGRTSQETIICKLNIVCNSDDLPPFKDKQGFANRVKVFPFKNKFKKDPKKADEIMNMKDDYFTELCHYVKEYFYDNDMTINFTKEVEDATNEYKDEIDTIKQFFNSCVSITKDEKDRIPKQNVFNMYRDFCMDYEHKNMLTKNKFYKTLETDYGLEIYRKTDYKGIKQIETVFNDFEDEITLI